MPKHGRRAFFLESNGKAIKQPNLFYACSKSTEFVCYKNVVKNISWHCLQRYSKRRTRDPRGISTDISLFFAHTWCKIFFWCWHGGRALCCAMASQKKQSSDRKCKYSVSFPSRSVRRPLPWLGRGVVRRLHTLSSSPQGNTSAATIQTHSKHRVAQQTSDKSSIAR